MSYDSLDRPFQGCGSTLNADMCGDGTGLNKEGAKKIYLKSAQMRRLPFSSVVSHRKEVEIVGVGRGGGGGGEGIATLAEPK